MKVRYNFTRDHQPGEYIGFEIRACYEYDEWVCNVEDADEMRELTEEGTRVFWGVYGVDPDGMSESLGDFATEQYALETVAKLGGRLESSW